MLRDVCITEPNDDDHYHDEDSDNNDLMTTPNAPTKDHKHERNKFHINQSVKSGDRVAWKIGSISYEIREHGYCY